MWNGHYKLYGEEPSWVSVSGYVGVYDSHCQTVHPIASILYMAYSIDKTNLLVYMCMRYVTPNILLKRNSMQCAMHSLITTITTKPSKPILTNKRAGYQTYHFNQTFPYNPSIAHPSPLHRKLTQRRSAPLLRQN